MATFNFNTEKKTVAQFIQGLCPGVALAQFNKAFLSMVPTHVVNRNPEPFNQAAMYFYFDLPFDDHVSDEVKESTFTDCQCLLKVNTFENPLSFEMPKNLNWYSPSLAYPG